MLSRETFTKKSILKEQLFKYALQLQHLNLIQTYIQQSVIDKAAYSCFRGATLFMHSKNTKLEYIIKDLSSTYQKQQGCQSSTTNTKFYSKDYTFINLSKQITSKDSNLLDAPLLALDQAEVFLQKRYYLESYYKSRVVLLVDSKLARVNLKCTIYLFTTTRDSTN